MSRLCAICVCSSGSIDAISAVDTIMCKITQFLILQKSKQQQKYAIEYF